MSSNLPPGVTEGMLPGNRPEDAQRDRWMEHLADQGEKLCGEVEDIEALMSVIEFVRVNEALPQNIDQLLDDVFVALEEMQIERNAPDPDAPRMSAF